jgi:hypothetical protein
MTAVTPTTSSELDKLGLDTLLPDEDVAAFKALRDNLLEEFGPMGAYQLSLAMNLVAIEWDIARHRRLMAATLREEFRRQSLGVRDYGAPGKSESYVTTSDDFSFGRGILAGSRDTIPVLAKSGVTLSEITAAALSSRLDAVGYHEGRIADLERRRRSLRDDYERLKAKRKPPEDIEDAVEVL